MEFLSMRMLFRAIGLVVDAGTWIEPEQVLACRYPRRESALASLAQQQISVLINLHERGHDPSRLVQYGLVEVHLPVKDFSTPSDAQVEQGIASISEAVASGKRVAVHCGAGLGRTGTLLACYLVRQGWDAGEAIVRIRSIRPGSVETARQVAAVEAYARRRYRPLETPGAVRSGEAG